MQISPELIAIIVGAIALLWLILTFNGLVGMRNRVQNAW